MIQDNRLRLMQLAGPGARFTWWGEDGNGDAFLTAWAWYADWQASQALGVTQQPEYWQHMLDSYAEQADNMPLLHRALVLAWAQEMNLPCKTLLKGWMKLSPGAELKLKISLRKTPAISMTA